MILFATTSWLLFLFLYFLSFVTAEPNERKRIAVVGGGVAGTFSSRYLIDLDTACQVESITIFEPNPVTRPLNAEEDVPDDDWQGSRVASLKVQGDDDGNSSSGAIVELGASIGYKEFHLVLDMIRSDPTLVIGPPGIGSVNSTSAAMRKGIGVYDGNGWWPVLTSKRQFMNKFSMLFRYNFDLLKVTRATNNFIASFANIPILLDSRDPGTFFQSPDDIWRAVGLAKPVYASFDQLLDVMGLPRRDELPWWRRILPYQGSLREEFLEPINLNNYNQENAQVNALVGMGSFAASLGGVFSIQGGNYQLVRSAYQQALNTRKKNCGGDISVTSVSKRITKVVAGWEGSFTLYGDNFELLGTFDVVILAAPLQFARIEFLVQSRMDEAVLQPMHLGSVHPMSESKDVNGQEVSSPPILPDSATRSYTQVVTTVISNATLTEGYFSLPDSDLPRFIIMTARGKATVHNITTITQMAKRTYKIFSSEKLDTTVLSELFGAHYKLEYVKLWGGTHGGATPDYQGQGTAAPFLLYSSDVGAVSGASGLSVSGGAIYYACAMEQSTLASMELAAIGAKAVAKLVAQRLRLLAPLEQDIRDEL